MYNSGMTNKKPRKVGYGYNRSRKDFSHMDLDCLSSGEQIIILDAPGTKRQGLESLIDPTAATEGDVISICEKSDLGNGAKAPSIMARYTDIGGKFLVSPPPNREKTDKRLKKSHPNRWAACLCWWGPMDAADKLDAMQVILGQRIVRGQGNRFCGGSHNPPQSVRDQIKAECSAQKT